MARVWACYAYEWPLRPCILAFKNSQRPALGYALGTLLAQSLPRGTFSGIDAILPVPLHAQRLRERGFNQSAVLARALCQQHALPLRLHQVQRSRATPHQQGRNRVERQTNLADAFTVRTPCTDERLLLVDDVMTTGATLQSMAQALHAAGVAWVGAVVLARA